MSVNLVVWIYNIAPYMPCDWLVNLWEAVHQNALQPGASVCLGTSLSPEVTGFYKGFLSVTALNLSCLGFLVSLCPLQRR